MSVSIAAQVLMHVTWACDGQVGYREGRGTWGGRTMGVSGVKEGYEV